jgi:hypothetical protein
MAACVLPKLQKGMRRILSLPGAPDKHYAYTLLPLS